jgi:5-methylcytosine-specific restriction endonuclease McrA
MLQRPCLSCNLLATPGKSRCLTCTQAKERSKQAKRLASPGDRAAKRVRAQLSAAGYGACNGCGDQLPATALQVDHVVPLADGGSDYMRNLQLLCTPCHLIKTKDENAKRQR